MVIKQLAALSTTLLLIGCGSQPAPTVTATGTVTVQGAPLSGAVVTLEPIGQTTGPNVSVPVWEGKFDVATDGGLHGGTYRVRVAMIPAEIRKSIPSDVDISLPPADAVIDPTYDANSQITCELSPGQDNELTLAVKFL